MEIVDQNQPTAKTHFKPKKHLILKTFVLILVIIAALYFGGIFKLKMELTISPKKEIYTFGEEITATITLKNFSIFPKSYSGCGIGIIKHKTIDQTLYREKTVIPDKDNPSILACNPESKTMMKPFEKKEQIKTITIADTFDPSDSSGLKMRFEAGENILFVEEGHESYTRGYVKSNEVMIKIEK